MFQFLEVVHPHLQDSGSVPSFLHRHILLDLQKMRLYSGLSLENSILLVNTVLRGMNKGLYF